MRPYEHYEHDPEKLQTFRIRSCDQAKLRAWSPKSCRLFGQDHANEQTLRAWSRKVADFSDKIMRPSKHQAKSW